MPGRSRRLACAWRLPAVAAEPKTPAQPKTAAEYITRGLRRLDTWQWPEALADANEALRLQPGSARAMLVRGAAKAGMEDVAAGLRDLAEAEKRGERSPRLYCEQGLAYLRREAVRQGLGGRRAGPEDQPQRAPRLRPAGTGHCGAEGPQCRPGRPEQGGRFSTPRSAYGYGVRGEVMADWDINLGPTPPTIATLQAAQPARRLAEASRNRWPCAT